MTINVRATIAGVLTAVLAVLAGSTTPAGAAITTTRDTLPTDNADVSRAGPVPVLSWRMPDRFGLVPKTFDDVNPRSWQVEIDTCKSWTREGRVRSIRWKLFDAAGAQLLDSPTCKRSVTVGSLGSYRIDLTIAATNGTRTFKRPIELKDHLIVVAGDSMASGEGNPDIKGHAKLELCGQTVDTKTAALEFGWLSPECILDLGHLLAKDIPSIVDGTPSTWKLDPDCHRSYKSGMSLAAREIERRDPHSSVTYINVACSGAEVKHLFSDPYDGLYTSGPWDTGRKRPQSDQIADLVCGRVPSCADPRVRPVAGIFLAIGINDLSLSDVLTDCMKPDFKQILGVDGCQDSSFDTIEKGLSGLRPAFGFGNRLHDLGVPVTSVYHAAYPTHVFTSTSSGCGVFRFINDGEKAWLEETNQKLNQHAVYQAFTPHYHWRPVWRDPLVDPWNGHGYCTGSKRWFNSLYDSLTQYNGLQAKVANGAVHPNAKGHDQFRKEFLNEWDQRTRPVTDRVLVTIEQVRVTSVEKAHHGWLNFTAGRRGSDGVTRFGVAQALEIPDDVDVRSGAWVDLRDRKLQLPLGLNAAEQLRVAFFSANNMPPEPDRCPDPSQPPEQLRRAAEEAEGGAEPGGDLPCIRPIVRGFSMQRLFAKSQAWGSAGTQTMTDASGHYKVRYRIERIRCKVCMPTPGIRPLELARA
jgi:hypothetical protein